MDPSLEREDVKRAAAQRMIALMYGGAAALLGTLFIGVLYGPLKTALPENDIWWMMPTVAHYTAEQPFWPLARFLLSPAPLILGQPVLKIYLWLGLALFGGATTPLLCISLAVHLANGVLLYLFGRQLAFGRRVSICAALVYLTFFAHFHAYLWPTAFQHLFGVTTILSLISLYLHTESLGPTSPRARQWFLTTLTAALFASLQRSTLIAPALILAHILCSSKNASERAVRYDRWLPLFLLYAIYPIMALTFIGDPIIATALARTPLGHALTAGALLAVVLAGLCILRGLVRAYPRYRHRRLLTRALPVAGLFAAWVALVLRDHRQLLLPYNALLPLVSSLTSFLDPIHKALALDAAEPYYQMPAQAGVAVVLLAAALLAVFAVRAASRQRLHLLVVVWYALTLLRLNVYSYLIRVPSRYFIYLSPVVALLSAWALVAVVDLLHKRARLKPMAGHAVLAGLVVLLCVPNVLAIRLALFRGRLANTYDVYDDVRAARLMRDDLQSRGLTHLTPEALAVQQALPLDLRESSPEASVNPAAYDTLRAVVAETFGDPAMRGLQVNIAPAAEGTRAVYLVDETRIRTADGEEADPFARLLDRALERLHAGQEAEALALVEQAIATRPFLLRYALARCPLEDARWLAGGADLRRWVDAAGLVRAGWSQQPSPKQAHIAAVMHQELSDYLLCLVCAAYLEERAGHTGRSRAWLARTRIIDGDPGRWLAAMRAAPAVVAHPSLQAFLQQVDGPGAIGDPQPWRQDDYGVERFVMRLILRWDIRSRQETLAAATRPPHAEWPSKHTPLPPTSVAGGPTG